MKKIFNRYMRPTPKKWRVFGDACLALSGIISAYTFNNPQWQDWSTLTVIILLIAGKFATNFNTDEKN